MVGGRSRKKLMVCTYFKRFISTPWFIEAECLGKKKSFMPVLRFRHQTNGKKNKMKGGRDDDY